MANASKKLSLLFLLAGCLFADYSYDDHGNVSSIYIPLVANILDRKLDHELLEVYAALIKE